MGVLGIDCGIAITGWSVLNKTSQKVNNGIQIIDYGVIRTTSKAPIAERLTTLYDELEKLLVEYKVDSVAIESLFYFKNQKTIINVSQARGVTILAAAKRNLEVYDYTPLQVKQAVTGYGKATKEQVQKMVKAILNLKEIPKPDDAADAIAVAVCHLSTVK